MVGEAGAVVVLEDWVGGDQGLDDHVVDVGPDLLYVVAVTDEPLVHCGDFSMDCYRNQKRMILLIVGLIYPVEKGPFKVTRSGWETTLHVVAAILSKLPFRSSVMIGEYPVRTRLVC